MDTYDSDMRAIRRSMNVIKVLMIVSSHLSIILFFMVLNIVLRS